MEITWHIDHDYGSNAFLLVGDYRGQRFVKGVRDILWGLPIMYARWCIVRRFKALYPEDNKKAPTIK